MNLYPSAKSHSGLAPLLSGLLAIIISSCGGITPVWSESCDELEETKTLYYQTPCVYKLNTSELIAPGPYVLELSLTYYSQIRRSELPLFLILEDGQKNTQDFYFSIPLKNGGKDLGVPAENEIDLTLSHVAIQNLDLPAEEYTFRLFFDGERMMENEVEGILGLEARLYNAEEYASDVVQ